MKYKPTVHLILYRKIKRMSNGRFVGHHSVMEIMKRFFPYFSRVLYYPIIKDLERDKLLKKLDKTKYEIIGGQADNALNKHNCPI